MAFKFCPSCGNEIVDGQKFCTKCGYNLFKDQQDYSEEAETTQHPETKPIQQPETEPQPQPGPAEESQLQPGQEAEQTEPSINVNVPAPLSTNDAGGLKRDYKEDRVTQYKRLMGMNTGVYNTVSGEIYKGASRGIASDLSSVLDELRSSWFVLSFEYKGIVLIGVDSSGHFNENNGFISNDIIQSVKVNKALGYKTLVFTTLSGDSLQFYISFALSGCPYQRQNYNNLENLVSKYNK